MGSAASSAFSSERKGIGKPLRVAEGSSVSRGLAVVLFKSDCAVVFHYG